MDIKLPLGMGRSVEADVREGGQVFLLAAARLVLFILALPKHGTLDA